MTVYVDDGFVAGGWGRWQGGGHMQADTLEELHAMASRLGLKRSWFQSKPGRPWHDHYDLTRGKREQAIRLGAVPITWREAAKRNLDARASRHARPGAPYRRARLPHERKDPGAGTAVDRRAQTERKKTRDRPQPADHRHRQPRNH